MVEHVVEGGAELAHLGARVAGQRPVAQRHVPAGQWQRGHPLGGAGHLMERTQGQPDQYGARQPRGQQGRGEDDQLDHGEALDGVVDAGRRQPGEQHVSVATAVCQHAIVAQYVEMHAMGVSGRPQRGQFARIGCGDQGTRAVVGDHSGLRQLTVDHPSAQGADGLAGDLTEPAGGNLRIAVGRHGIGVPSRGARGGGVAGTAGSSCAVLQADGVPAAGSAQLLVQSVEQEAAQRQRGGQPDGETGEREQQQHAGQEPGPQRPPAQPGAAAVRRGPPQAGWVAHRAGLSTYPTPRTVWIIGSRPASIFLRR